MQIFANRLLVLDVDDTLYSRHNGMHERIKQRIAETPAYFIKDFTALKKDSHGDFTNFTDLVLALGRKDPALQRAYVRHVYAAAHVGYEQLRPDPALRKAISEHPGGVGVYTNGIYHHHARMVLERLGLADILPEQRVVDIIAAGDGHTKPSLAGYRHACARLGTIPEATIFADDSVPNIAAAKKLGAATIWVNELQKPYPQHLAPPDLIIEHQADLATVIASFHSLTPTHPHHNPRTTTNAQLKR